MADLSVGRVATVAQGIDHRVLEVRAPPPGDEAVGITAPALLLQKRRDRLPQARLHVDNGAVLIEDQHLDLALEDVGAFHAHFPHALALARADCFAAQRARCGQLGGTGSFTRLANSTLTNAVMSAMV